ncbi:MAG: VacJ family lipoprotein, partial [Pseudomonadota bacterium]
NAKRIWTPHLNMSRIIRFIGFFGLALTVAACSTPGPGHVGVYDPHETVNRQNHELNRALDRALLRPAGVGYSEGMPDDLEDSVSNFASNLSLPGNVVNNLLQGNIEGAFRNTVRFVVNSTLGFGGLFDPAGDFGIEEIQGDFGQTLYVWGVPEGAYVELPGLGPSTERDAVGRIVDLATNPLSYVLPSPEKYAGTAARAVAGVGARGRYAETIDSVLYDSADSYAQTRQIYLQNRRFELGDDTAIAAPDPFELDTEGF